MMDKNSPISGVVVHLCFFFIFSFFGITSGTSIDWGQSNNFPLDNNAVLNRACAIINKDGIRACWDSIEHPELGWTGTVALLDQTGNLIEVTFDNGRWENGNFENRIVECDAIPIDDVIEQDKQSRIVHKSWFQRNWNELTSRGGANRSIDSADVGKILSIFLPNIDLSSKNVMESVGQKCAEFRSSMMGLENLSEKSSSEMIASKPKQRRRQKRSYLIFPGTNWCGNGNAAKYSSDFGANTGADQCCKQHDSCPYSIAGFSTRFNLFNYRFHTLSHCECDKLFKQCLIDADTTSASIVGKVYFNVVSTQCFDLKLEKICIRRNWWGTCAKQSTQWVASMTTIGGY